VRSLLFLLTLCLASCTAWDRSVGASRYSTPLTFTRPAPEHPLANLDRDFPVTPAARREDQDPARSAPSSRPPPLEAVQEMRALGVYRTTSKGIALTLLVFDDRSFALSVADKQGGPATEWASAQGAAQAAGALAAINASFFTPEGEPLGLVIEQGKRFGSWNTASSLTSGVLVVRGRQCRLLRRNLWPRAAAADHLVQAGPFLLENGEKVSGLSSTSARPRSFLAWDGRHHWAMGFAESATLAQLSAALAAQPLAGTRFATALNLDGGRSCDFWVARTVEGGPVSTRKFWNNPVRNYLLLRKR